MKVLVMFLSTVSLAGCPLKGGSTTPQPKQQLQVKPTELTVIEVPGAQLVVSDRFRVFIVDGEGEPAKSSRVDRAALEAKAGECASGGSCGRKMSTKEVTAFYQTIEGASWASGRLAGQPAADSRVGSAADARVLVFTGALQDLLDATRQLFIPGGYCDPTRPSPVHPQCPPPPIPPRIPELDIIVNLDDLVVPRPR